MTRLLPAYLLQAGDVMALPFGKTATITNAKLGRQYVTLRFIDLPQSRIGKYEEVLIETDDADVAATRVAAIDRMLTR